MEPRWITLFVAWFLGSSAFTGHLLIVFYSKDFVWDDLTPKLAIEKSKAYYHQNPCVHWKFWVCGLAMVMCRSGWVSMLQGQLLMLLLALPQLYRAKGEPSRQLRVILGPLTPILSVNNLLQSCCVASVVQFIICFLAFVVFRPDNTSVLGLCWRRTEDEALPPYVGESKIRRRLHGSLAAGNAAVCLVSLVTTKFIFQELSW